jgi:hypothetical protein
VARRRSPALSSEKRRAYPVAERNTRLRVYVPPSFPMTRRTSSNASGCTLTPLLKG